MDYFRDYTFTWWQVGLLKLCMLAAGIAIGASWPQAFAGWTAAFWMIFAITAVYLMRVTWEQW